VSAALSFFCAFKLGLIPTETHPGPAAQVALNLLPLAAMAAAVICAVLLSIRFYRAIVKRFFSDRIPN
jgi:hypothetical protein